MSEDKNTALGSRARIGYSHVVPTTPHAPPAMISVALVLAALVLLTGWDTA